MRRSKGHIAHIYPKTEEREPLRARETHDEKTAKGRGSGERERSAQRAARSAGAGAGGSLCCSLTGMAHS